MTLRLWELLLALVGSGFVTLLGQRVIQAMRGRDPVAEWRGLFDGVITELKRERAEHARTRQELEEERELYEAEREQWRRDRKQLVDELGQLRARLDRLEGVA